MAPPPTAVAQGGVHEDSEELFVRSTIAQDDTQSSGAKEENMLAELTDKFNSNGNAPGQGIMV